MGVTNETNKAPETSTFKLEALYDAADERGDVAERNRIAALLAERYAEQRRRA